MSAPPTLATLDNSYHFVCSNGHHFKCTLRELVENDFHCPVCEGKRVDPEKTSLQALNPELASEFSVNNKSTASQIAFDTSKKVLWTCPTCGEDYLYPVNERKIGDNSCPYCNHTKLKSGVNDLTITNPQLASEFSPRNDKKANEVGEWQKYEVFWICPTCKREFRREVRKMAAGVDECPICTGRVAIEGYNSLADEHPEIVSLWSINNDKKPTEVTSTSSYSALWCCPTCGEEYRGQVRDMVSGTVDCPICSGKKARAGFNSLLDIYPEVQDEWAENENTLLGIFPDEILPTSTVRVWWECKDCGRKYLLSVNMWVEKHIRGMTSCTYCSGLRMRETHVLL